MTGEAVENNFINRRLIVNSKECFWRESSGQASVAYNKTGKHFVRISEITTSCEAKRPTLLKIELNERKNLDLASLKQHLNVLPLTKNTPKYLHDSTQLMGPPNDEIISEHCASHREPNRMHVDFLTLTSSSSSI